MVFSILILIVAAAQPLNLSEEPGIFQSLSQVLLEYPTISIVASLLLLGVSGLIMRGFYKKWTMSSEVTLILKSRHLNDKEYKSLIC